MDMKSSFLIWREEALPASRARCVRPAHVVARYGRDVIDCIRADQPTPQLGRRWHERRSRAAGWPLQSRQPERTDAAASRTTGGQPAAGYGLCPQGCAEGCPVRPQRTRGLAPLANLAAARPAACALQRFARNLRKYARGIASANFICIPASLRASNNRIKVIAAAHGFDPEYFFLKIMPSPESAITFLAITLGLMAGCSSSSSAI